MSDHVGTIGLIIAPSSRFLPWIFSVSKRTQCIAVIVAENGQHMTDALFSVLRYLLGKACKGGFIRANDELTPVLPKQIRANRPVHPCLKVLLKQRNATGDGE